jgi:hypothetical protein
VDVLRDDRWIKVRDAGKPDTAGEPAAAAKPESGS